MLAQIIGDLKLDQMPVLIISGVILGSIYFLMASGIVVVSRLTNTLNFAQGGIATVSAFLFYLELQPKVRTIPAFILSALGGAAVAAVIDRVTIRGANEGRDGAVRALTVTVGWMLLLPALGLRLWDATSTLAFDVFPTSTAFTIADVNVTKSQVGIFTTTVSLCLLLVAFLRWTPFGMMMRATAANGDAARLLGIRVGLVSGLNWAIGGIFAATAGVFVSPNLSLRPYALTLLVIPALAAAMVGGLRSLAWTFVGAMILGIGSNTAAAAFPDIRGIRESVPFVVIMVALAVQSGISIRARTVARA